MLLILQASQELASQRLQELLSLTPLYPHSTQQQSQSQSHHTQSQSQEHATEFSTSQEQPNDSDAHTAPVEYYIPARVNPSFSSASDYIAPQNNSYPQTTDQYYPSPTGSVADIGITVEHVSEPSRMFYNVQASHSLSSLVRPTFLRYLFLCRDPRLCRDLSRIYLDTCFHLSCRSLILSIFAQGDVYQLTSGAYPPTHTHSSPHSSGSRFTPPNSNTPASDTGESPHPRNPPFLFPFPTFHFPLSSINCHVTS